MGLILPYLLLHFLRKFMSAFTIILLTFSFLAFPFRKKRHVLLPYDCFGSVLQYDVSLLCMPPVTNVQ